MASSSSSTSKDMISAMNLIWSSVPAMALKCALLLKIPDIIASAGQGQGHGPDAIPTLSIPQIADRMEKYPQDLDYLSRIVRYLSSIGVFEEMEIKGEIVYGLTHMTKTYFVTQGNPANLAAFHMFFNDEVTQAAWQCLKESVVEGQNAFQIAHGSSDLWDYANNNARFNGVANDGMLSLDSVVFKDAFPEYDGFKDVTTLVNIGGGFGRTLAEIMAANSQIQGINFDLPHVVANAPHIPGIQHIGGNMFDSIPSGDVCLLKHVLHNWNDECCVKVLKNCHEALPRKGKLILLEGVMDWCQDSYQSPQLLDLTMLALTNGGKVRSQQQWNELLSSCGFLITKFVGREKTILKIIEAIKISTSLS